MHAGACHAASAAPGMCCCTTYSHGQACSASPACMGQAILLGSLTQAAALLGTLPASQAILLDVMLTLLLPQLPA